ncbi:MAG: 2-isopropylmalate synthase [Deltaproteobacteria bacterium RIFCSPLOWO2_12_FULL_50_11]|nr:MAG: 2-isopropylmalate synthase [Deltaproteobacteria bacterium RIFCSPLOWO2_12_FULL_50_11]
MSENIKIFDTTLRDGEQSPGFSMDVNEKLRLAEQLARLNVDIIEAGFPIASEGDFSAVERIAKTITGPIIAGLARTNIPDIDRCWEAVRHAAKPRIHTFIATSDIHLKHKLKKSRQEVIDTTVMAVGHAKKYVEDVEFSAEDATRSDPDYLTQIFTAAIEAGATTINVPDTVGYTIPSEYQQLIEHLTRTVPNIRKATISVHCHNDLGLAVANSLAAIEKGARQVECTINGIGERAGNASMEEIVMSLFVRRSRLNFDTQIVRDQIYQTSRLLTHITGIPVQPNKAIVGANAFAHEAGIHQDGVLKERLTYEIMTPQSIGLATNRLHLGKHSGRHALKQHLDELGYKLNEEELKDIFKRFKDLADRKKSIYDEDLDALMANMIHKKDEIYILEEVRVESGSHIQAKATITMTIKGKKVTEKFACGDGPVDAVFQAIRKLTDFHGKLVKFSINAVTGGTDAQGEVMVAIEDEGRVEGGVGSHTDIVVASGMAYVNALNRLVIKNRAVEAHL